ncbi:MAG: hypothetical protein RL616_2128, partial [Verrucomicrobiota bacterium]
QAQRAGAIEPVGNWLLQVRANGNWTTQILPVGRTDCYFDNATPEAISVRAVDRAGNLSTPIIWSPKKYSSTEPVKGGERMKGN